MINNKLFFIIIPIIILVFLFFTFNKYSNSPKKILINNQIILADVADTNEKRMQGLSGKKYMESNKGMLFVFSKPEFHRFWMKGMNFPLDFVWINDRKVVDLSENIPNPGPGSLYISQISPKYPVDKVLEINAGSIKSYNIKIGDVINY